MPPSFLTGTKDMVSIIKAFARALLVIIFLCLTTVVINCMTEFYQALEIPVSIAMAQDKEKQAYDSHSNNFIATDGNPRNLHHGIRAQLDLYGGTGDGYVRNTGSTWEAARETGNKTPAQLIITNINELPFSYRAQTMTVGTGHTADDSFEIARAFIPFDTSTIPNHAYITEAALNLYITATAANPSIRIVRSSQSNTAYILQHDYSKCQYDAQDDPPKKLSDDTMVTSSGSYQAFPLNLDGIAWLNKSSWTTFGIREAQYDASDIIPPLFTNSSAVFHTANHSSMPFPPCISTTITIPEYVIEKGSDDTCEKNKREQGISGYERKKRVAVSGDTPQVFSLPEKDGSGGSWIAHLFPLASTEGAGKIEDVTVTYHPDYTDAGTSVKLCIAVEGKDPFPQPELPYNLTPQFHECSYTWLTNPYTGRSWSWHDINSMSIGIMLKDTGAKEIQPPLPHELYATITYKNLFLGSDAENNIYDLGLRFDLIGASRIKNFTYARLILPTNEFRLSEHGQLKLRITGQDIADAGDFSSERPSEKVPVTSNDIDWPIDRADLPVDMNGVHATQAILTSPNIAPVINESARNAAWSADGDNRNIALTIACISDEPEDHNIIYLADYEAGLLYNPIALELYTSVYDCFIARETVARVTDTSALIHCISLLSLDFFVEYKAAGTYRWRATSRITRSMPGQPIEVTLRDLSPATEYLYRVVYRETGNKPFSRGMAHSFRTQRAEGDEFTFTIESDTHVRYSEEAVAWQESTGQLQMKDLSWDTIEKEGADFHINLGDWFEGRVGHCITETTAVYDYIKTKAYQGTRCWPTYFALGNHEGENPTQDAYHLNARSARMKVIPNPDTTVSTFYKNPNPYESYYAWEWGDALFIVLDPYSYCTEDPDKDPWNWTLGKTQYDWLYHTLSSSRKKWKFVFLHQLLGGKREVRNYGRGGIEYAKFKVKQNATYEWGGEDQQGNNVWSQKRPGWKHGALHDMLEAQGVTALFHGHDHGFAHQTLDGIHYIECPTISGVSVFQRLYDEGFLKAADYENGITMGNNGYIRVRVNPEKILIEYIGTIRDVDEAIQGYKNGEIRYAAVLEEHGH